MKKIKLICSIILLLALTISCTNNSTDTDTSFLGTTAPSNITSIFDVTNDNTGKVTITPAGEASSYTVYFGDTTTSSANVSSGSNVSHNYAEGSYTVKIVGLGINGVKTEKTYPLTILYRAPENLAVTLTTSGVNLKVKATALYANSYLVYYGDVANEIGTPLATGAEVSHNYSKVGNYDVKVVALSGGVAKVEKITPVSITVPFIFPIDFENPNVNYFFGVFGGGQSFTKVANPNKTGLNTSATVGEFKRGWDSWSGTYSPLNASLDFATGKKVKVWVYNPDPINIGKKLNVELETGTIANGIAVLKVALTKSGDWEELVFDFSTISAIPANAKFNQLVLRFNDGVNGDLAVIYIDNFRFTN